MMQKSVSPFSSSSFMMIRLSVILSCLLLSCLQTIAIIDPISGFSCQGTEYESALTNCLTPAGFVVQRQTAGGNVTINVQRGINIPNSDYLGPVAGVSDPYVRFRIGDDVSVRTKAIVNSLSPQWNEDVSLGFVLSATEVTVELWDEDSGLEFADDLLKRTTIRVPYCSMFSAPEVTKSCVNSENYFQCSSDDSLWKMPKRRQCSESGVINFTPTKRCTDSGAICVYVTISLIPFQLQSEVWFENQMMQQPTVTATGSPNAARWPWTSRFSYPYSSGPQSNTQTDTANTRALQGALMFQFRNDDKDYGEVNEIKMFASVNFPATIYICRETEYGDHNPDWFSSEGYDGKFRTARQLMLTGTVNRRLPCYLKDVPGTSKNRWGGVLSGEIPLFTNIVSGQTIYTYNYVALAVPKPVVSPDDEIRITYDAGLFLELLVTYGLGTAIFVFIASGLLDACDYRLDRLSNFVVSRVLTGENRSLVAALLLNNGKSVNNIEYRAHMYHAKNTLIFILIVPFVLVFSWGICVSKSVEPQNLGLFIAFIGPSFFFGWFAYNLWKRSQWRLSMLSVVGFGLCAFFLVLFLLASLFGDPVFQQTKEIDLIALSMVFASLNVIPNMVLLFKNDRSHKIHMELVMSRIAEAVYRRKKTGNSTVSGAAMKEALTAAVSDLKVNRMLHALLGDSYSLNPSMPALKFSTVLSELNSSFQNLSDRGEQFKLKSKEEQATLANRLADQLLEERRWYYCSLVILFIYLMIAVAHTDQGSLAFLNCLALCFLDFLHLGIAKGDVTWSPGFKVTLLVMGRLLISSSPRTIWVMNYSACYLLYALTLSYEMINVWFPKLSERSASEILFGGGTISESMREALRSRDMIGTPSFCLLALSVVFITVLVIAQTLPTSFSDPSSETILYVPDVTVLGMEGWQVTILGCSAILTFIVGTFAIATWRVYSLSSVGLLSGWGADAYFLRNWISLPMTLALATWLSILLSGLAVFAISGSKAVMVSAIFVPLILLLLGDIIYRWMNNSYDLVTWPRQKAVEASDFSLLLRTKNESKNETSLDATATGAKNTQSNGDDLEAAYGMMAGVFGATGASISDVAYDLVEEYDEGAELDGSHHHLYKSEQHSKASTSLHNDDATKTAPPSSLSPRGQKLKAFVVPSLHANGFTANDTLDSSADGARNGGDNEVRMPALPLKSVLRRKRNNLGIKTTGQSLVKELRPRGTAGDGDQFGDGGDVLDVMDPWAQFEAAAEEEALLKKKKKATRISTANSKKSRDGNKTETESDPNQNMFLKLRKWMRRISPPKWIRSIYSTSETPVVPVDTNLEEEFDPEGGEGGEDELAMRNRLRASQEALRRRQEQETHRQHVADLDLRYISPDQFPFWDAFLYGMCNREEYLIIGKFFLLLLLLMFYGLSLVWTITPVQVGYCIWALSWTAIFTVAPVVRYLQRYVHDETNRQLVRVAVCTHLVFCISMIATLGSRNSDYQYGMSMDVTLWMFDWLFYLPLFVYVCFSTLVWVDGGMKSPLLGWTAHGIAISKNGRHASLPWMQQVIFYAKSLPSVLLLFTILNVQVYIWAGDVPGAVMTLVLILFTACVICAADWAANDQFISPEYLSFGRMCLNLTVLVTAGVALFREVNPLLPLSICLWTLMLFYLCRIFGRWMAWESDTQWYFSPFLFPVYSLGPQGKDLCDENGLMADILLVIVYLVFWGISMTVFATPVHVGVSITCCIVLLCVAGAALCVSTVSRQLARCHTALSVEAITEAAKLARAKFQERREPLRFEMSQWEGADDLPDEDTDIQLRPAEGMILREKSCFLNCLALLQDIRALKYVQDESGQMNAEESEESDDEEEKKDKGDDDEEEEEELPTMWERIQLKWKSFKRAALELLPMPANAGWKRHNQGLFTTRDALIETVMRGRGPYGVFGLEGWPLQSCIETKHGRLGKFLYPAWTEDYDTVGNDIRLAELSEPLDWTVACHRIDQLDDAIDATYCEESRCAILFLSLLLRSAEAHLACERVLFQRFLRENRVRLASNGVILPSRVFNSTSYASTDLRLTAQWLRQLNEDEQERFYRLKTVFDEEQREREQRLDQEDAAERTTAEEIQENRREHDKQVRRRLDLEMGRHQERRIQRFAESLEGYEKSRFQARRELWTTQRDCFVDLREQDLYNRFRDACLRTPADELREYARSVMIDCETAQRDIRVGEYGRTYQFVDSEFPPQESSLGDSVSSGYVWGWRCAPGIVEGVQLFENGTSVDDICRGVFPDDWFLSAITMMLASSSGESRRGVIHERIRRLFLSHPSAATIGLGEAQEEETLDTEVGAYAVQIHRQGEWLPVIVDDLLPMRHRENWTTANRGIAASHCHEGQGLWLSLLEKAYAKYYGTYASLRHGFVHHALEDLTGCETKCLYLQNYTRSVSKFGLWDELGRWVSNGFILGAGTGSADLVDRELLEMGLAYDAEYTILDVFAVDGLRLVKLRVPPGQVAQWRGDWGPTSQLWTRRLRVKLGVSLPGDSVGSVLKSAEAAVVSSAAAKGELDEDDISMQAPTNGVSPTTGINELDVFQAGGDKSTFFMSFDDFLHVFRRLYVCKDYGGSRWRETKLYGLWKVADESAAEAADMMSQFLMEHAAASAAGQMDGGASIDGSSLGGAGAGSIEGAGDEGTANVEVDNDQLNRKKAKARLDTAGGLPSRHNPDCVLENNPHYSLRTYRPTDLRISVTQTRTTTRSNESNNGSMVKKNSSSREFHPFTILLVRCGSSSTNNSDAPLRLTVLKKEDVLATSGEAYAERTKNLYYDGLPEGQYIILVCPYLSGMEGEFTLSVTANGRADVTPVWPPVWMFREEHKAAGALSATEQFQSRFVEGAGVAKASRFLAAGFKAVFGGTPEEDDEEEEEEEVDRGGNNVEMIDLESGEFDEDDD